MNCNGKSGGGGAMIVFLLTLWRVRGKMDAEFYINGTGRRVYEGVGLGEDAEVAVDSV